VGAVDGGADDAVEFRKACHPRAVGGEGIVGTRITLFYRIIPAGEALVRDKWNPPD